jgi:uncharacterized membrane protein (DUF485 family)
MSTIADSTRAVPNPTHAVPDSARAAAESIHGIAARRWKVALTLSALMLVIYFGFILLVAFGKSWLSLLLAEGLSLGILLGALTIVSCWVLSLIYVIWANNRYDEAIARAMADTASPSERVS